MTYRVLRTPGGIEVVAEEDDRAVDDGYRMVLLGAHADVGSLFEQLRRMVRKAISRQYLERATHRDGWIMRGKEEVQGRLVWRDERPGYDVVVDGRRLSWEEFGAVLEPFEGWTFRLSMRDIDTAD
jgi:hypothetical protein